EEIAAKKPEAIVKISVNPLTGLQGYHLRSLSYKLKDLGLSSDVASKMGELAKNLYQIMLDLDADLVEINPLALIKTGELVALDSKIIIDDNALFKHPDLFESLSEDPRDFTESEIVARKYGFSYVELDGDVGVIANGAGLTMATMDMIAYFGGRPACFLDIGGGANRQRVKEAVKLLLRNPRIKVIMINIYGGITRCDEVAMGIVDAITETGIRKPLVIRMVGTREEEGIKILREHGMEPYMNDEEAAKRAVAIVRGE
ncbi:MAG: succinate--CoA ligase subunit beta, partial [Thermoprotei archaeon]